MIAGVLMIYPFDAEIPQFDPSQTAVETPPTTAYATDIVGEDFSYFYDLSNNHVILHA